MKIEISVKKENVDALYDMVRERWGYTDQVPNPKFNPEKKASSTNRENIDNPVGIDLFIVDKLKEYLVGEIATAEQVQKQRQVKQEAREKRNNFKL